MIELTVSEPTAIELEVIEAKIKPEQTKTVTPTYEAQTVLPDAGTTLGQVNVEAIPDPTTIKEIGSNGDHDVRRYGVARVDVQPTLQSKTATPTEQAQTVLPDTGYDGLESVEVARIPTEYIIPTGTKNISQNGVESVREYDSVNVSVEPTLQDKTVTPTKQTQTVNADSGYDGLDTVQVDPIPSEYIIPQGKVTINQNGTVDVSQYAEAEVSVPAILAAPRFEVKKKRVTFEQSTGSLTGALGYLCRLTETSNTVAGFCFYVVEKQNEWANGDYLWGETGYEPYGQNSGTWKARYSKYNGSTFVESSGTTGNVNGTISAGDVVDIFYIEILPTRSLMSSLLRGNGEQVLQPTDAQDPSDSGLMIEQEQTGNRYVEAIDIFPTEYTYRETDEAISEEASE